MDEQQPGPDEEPEFGPSGYLPERASKRARKIVLRAPLGLEWIVGSLVVGLVLVVSGVLLLREDGPPAPPFEVVNRLETIADSEVSGSAVPTPEGDRVEVLVVTVGGAPRVFLPPDGSLAPLPRWCDASGLLELPDGRTWRPTGRGTGGTASLVPLPSTVHEGRLYADPTAPAAASSPDADGPTPACDAAGVSR